MAKQCSVFSVHDSIGMTLTLSTIQNTPLSTAEKLADSDFDAVIALLVGRGVLASNPDVTRIPAEVQYS